MQTASEYRENYSRQTYCVTPGGTHANSDAATSSQRLEDKASFLLVGYIYTSNWESLIFLTLTDTFKFGENIE